MIKVLAVSLSGSEHIIIGKVVDKQSVPFASEEDARSHLTRIGWSDQRFAIDEQVLDNGKIRITWDNQSATEHVKGSGDFEYIRGGPKGGKKISKSELNQ